MIHPLTVCYFRPQPDMTVQELALVMVAIRSNTLTEAYHDGKIMPTNHWLALEPAVRRHFTYNV